MLSGSFEERKRTLDHMYRSSECTPLRSPSSPLPDGYRTVPMCQPADDPRSEGIPNTQSHRTAQSPQLLHQSPKQLLELPPLLVQLRHQICIDSQLATNVLQHASQRQTDDTSIGSSATCALLSDRMSALLAGLRSNHERVAVTFLHKFTYLRRSREPALELAR